MASGFWKVQLVVEGSPVGEERSIEAPDKLEARVLGSPSDRWGLEPSASEIESAKFGAIVTVDSAGDYDGSIDAIEIAVYTEIASPPGVGIPSKLVRTVKFARVESAPNDFRVSVKKIKNPEVES
jgi:hypothetical protein